MTRTQIVLGMDDSPASRAALRWAADYARLSGCSLRAIFVLPLVAHSPDEWPATDLAGQRIIPPEQVNESYRIRITNAFQSVHPSLGWVLHFIQGEAGPVLVEESQHSRLLVIGTREHTGLTRLVVGSVSHYCLNHAQCPVVAVPAPPVTSSSTTTTGSNPLADSTTNP